MTPRSAVLLVSALCAGSALSQANQVCYSDDFGTSSTNWKKMASVQQFDPALGILTGITVTFDGRVAGSLGIESLDASPALTTSTYGANITLLDYSSMPVVTLSPSTNFVDPLTVFDGTIDFAGTSGVAHLGIALAASGGYSPALTPATLAAFVGNGNVPFDAVALGTSIVTGPGNVISQILTAAGATITVCYEFQPDCDDDGISDADEIAGGALDLYGPNTCMPDGIPDSCQPESDCDSDGLPDRCEITGNDCDGNGIPDNCQPDCDANGIADACEILGGARDLYDPMSCQPDGIPDVCQPDADCDNDGIPDRCEIAGGTATDLDGDGIPDNCQPDCDNDGIPDAAEIAMGASDRYGAGTCSPDGIPDECQPEADCDADGLPNRCELAGNDCDGNGVPDDCQADCDADGIPDRCEIMAGAPDTYGPNSCSPDGIPDSCQPQPDCDNDGTPDRCEPDTDGDGIPNDCDSTGGTQGCTPGYWKNHVSAWPVTGYAPAMDFDTVFGVDAFTPNRTLLQAAGLGGGGMKALGRHAVAALLSASHPNVAYPLTAADVITLVQNAVMTGDIEATKDLLAGFNELGCPL